MTQSPNDTAKLACRNLWKVFGALPDGYRDPNALMRAGEPACENLRDHGAIPAVVDVSFDVAPGEIFVVMGLSGSGKSTLVRCLSRLIEPTAGQVLLDGEDILSASTGDLVEIRRRKMGMVFQDFGLLPHLTVLENVAFPLKIQGQDEKARLTRAADMISLVGLEGREQAFPRELSGGQQQRVGIARSLAVEPEIWFLDEPFSALDPLIRRQMQDEFLRLQKVLHKTIVFITHDFMEALKLADRVAIMKDGVVVQIAPPAELVLNPANDYVAEFTREAPVGRLLRARDVMGPTAPRDAAGPPPVPDDTALDQLVGIFARSGVRQIAVADADGAIVGSVDADALAHAFETREAAP